MKSTHQQSKQHYTGKNTSTLSIFESLLALSAPGREHSLQVRVTTPVTGDNLPIIMFAHGFGSSMLGYDPLVQFWAAHGFVVIQPTFLDSKTLLGIPDASHQDAIAAYLDNPKSASIWRQRVADMKHVLDQLYVIEKAVPALQGRLDHIRIAAVGHSFGAHTVGLLLGARVISTAQQDADMSDPRIKAGVLLSAGGRDGEALSDFANTHFAYLNQSYALLTTPTLVVAGDHDFSPLTILGPEWFTDAYNLSPGANALLTLFGGEHMLGGITGYLAEETTDENPERVALVQQMTLAYLRTTLSPNNAAWSIACNSLMEDGEHLGKVELK